MMIISNTIKNSFIFSNLKIINFVSILIFFFPTAIITGPFLPDLILSTIALIGLIIYLKKQINIIFYKEILFLWAFYFFSIISSLLSNNIIFSLDYSLFYFRFIIFSHFFIYLLINYPNLKILFLQGVLFSLFLIIIYSFIQLILFLNMDIIDGIRRLRLLFSDEEVVGSYIVRMLPIFCFFVFLNKDFFKSKLLKLSLVVLLLLSSFFIIYSGERTALILLLISILFYFLIFFKFYIKLSLIFLFSVILFIATNIILNQSLYDRTLQDLDRNISLDPKVNPYLNYSYVSLEMFKDSPILGKGPKMFRVNCPDEKYNNFKSMCNIHPHSLYVQLLGEMGIIGFIFLLTSFIYVLLIFFRNLLSKNPNILFLLASIGFIINFFPLIPSGNFFNNWINNLYYLSIIVIIYSMNVPKKIL